MFKLIAVIDRSRIIREGIAAILREGNICQRIGSLESLDEWRFAFKDTDPDLIIVSPELWRKNDIRKLKIRESAHKPIVVGIIYRYCDRETLGLFDETIYITDPDEAIINKLRHLQKYNHDTAKTQSLTAREKDVLRLLLQGYSNKEVADRLVISPHTAIAHRKNIIEKTGIRSLSGLAVYALLNNISDINHISK
ncbi:MAG: response regulator transcription factor [Bacteroidales bacterium]|jgi:DNA-binding NarL/FixJ family response regulator|nr:response regulator transcription factor [Bacteroidales bacterium]